MPPDLLTLKAMKMYMKIFFAVALVMAMAVAITLTNASTSKRIEEGLPIESTHGVTTSVEEIIPPSKRVNRFLAEEVFNPRLKYHCNKDYDVCYEDGSPGSTCCNNKCVDIKTDKKYCGACHKKCKFTETCCDGECVLLSLDKRHCGKCGTKCTKGSYCIYGMCDYA